MEYENILKEQINLINSFMPASGATISKSVKLNSYYGAIYDNVSSFCRAITEEIKGLPDNKDQAITVDEEFLYKLLKNEYAGQSEYETKTAGMNAIRRGEQQLFFTDDVLEKKTQQSLYWIDMCSILRKKFGLWGNGSFREFRNKFYSFMQRANLSRIIPYYSRSLQDIASYFAVYLKKGKSFYEDLYNTLINAHSQANICSQVNCWELTGAITDEIDSILDEYDGENLDEIKNELALFVSENSVNFGVATYATVSSRVVEELIRISNDNSKYGRFKEAVNRRNYEVVYLYDAIIKRYSKEDQKTRLQKNRSEVIRTLLNGKIDEVVKAISSYCLKKGLVEKSKMNVSLEEKIEILKIVLLKNQSIDYGKMQLRFVRYATKDFIEEQAGETGDDYKCAFRFDKKYTIIKHLRELYIIELVNRAPDSSDKLERINQALIDVGLNKLREYKKSNIPMLPNMCFDYVVINHIKPRTR